MRILCVDDDTESLDAYCEKYGLDSHLVDFAKDLNEAVEAISNPERRILYDLVLLDINIKGVMKEENKKYLHHIVREERLNSNESDYGGFYLYLALLHEGFPNDRIGFLSAYIDEAFNESQVEPEMFQDIKRYLSQTDRIEQDVLVAKLMRLKGTIETSDYKALQKMADFGEYKRVERKLGQIEEDDGLQSKMHVQEVPENNISGYFLSFENAGIRISEENKFNKTQNQFLPDEEEKATRLKSWIMDKDEARYYALRHGIIKGCQDLLDDLQKRKEKNKQTIDQAVEKFVHVPESDKHMEKLKLIETLETIDKTSLPFYQFGPYNNAQRELFRRDNISLQYNSNMIASRYNLGYFENMLETLKMLLPVRKPNHPQELYNHIVKMMTHPWEAAIASYKDSVYSREELFQNCISSVAKTTRNWTAHSRLKSFDVKDVAYLFIITMRSYFDMNLEEVREYEKHLLRFVFDKEDLDINQLDNHHTQLLTQSLEKLNGNKNGNVKDLNILNIFTSIGKYKDCETNYLYSMFYHIAHYPFVILKGNYPKVYFNDKHNNINNDIFSQLLKISRVKVGDGSHIAKH